MNMLKAAMEMLEKPSKTRVDCAKKVLQQVINHLEKVPNPVEIPTRPGNEGLSPDAINAQQELME